MAGGNTITLQQGTSWCETYRTENPGAVKAHLFSNSLIQDILNQNDCDGIRFYNGINDDDELCLVLVGVDSSSEDMTSGTLVERGDMCPPNCDEGSPLS